MTLKLLYSKAVKLYASRSTVLIYRHN